MKIEKRYQYFGPKGIIWSNWFTCFMGTAKESLDKIDELKKIKQHKFKSEYRLIDEDN